MKKFETDFSTTNISELSLFNLFKRTYPKVKQSQEPPLPATENQAKMEPR
jgi:hypothetical protein